MRGLPDRERASVLTPGARGLKRQAGLWHASCPSHGVRGAGRRPWGSRRRSAQCARLTTPTMGFGRGEKTMHPKPRASFVVAVAVLLTVRSTSGQVPRATIVSPDGTTTTYHVRDMDGHIVTVEVPSLASPDVKVSDPAQGTVQATVTAIDGATNQVKVQTHEGQTLVLDLAPE